MSFGFLGIQFGWGLPNMSAIEYLRARANQPQFSGWQRR
jgi:hypothetical protein